MSLEASSHGIGDQPHVGNVRSFSANSTLSFRLATEICTSQQLSTSEYASDLGCTLQKDPMVIYEMYRSHHI